MGADVVIASYVDCHGPRAQGLSAPAIIGRVMQAQTAQSPPSRWPKPTC
jgi:hypothetical protein